MAGFETAAQEVPPPKYGDVCIGDLKDIVTCILGLEITHKIAFILLCACLLTCAALHTGTYYTPAEDVFVYCVVYATWVTMCLPWLVQNMNGKVISMVAGVICRLFAAEAGVMAWGAVRGHRNLLHRGLRLKPLFEPSMSWLSEAGYNLRYGVVVAAVVAWFISVGIDFYKAITGPEPRRRSFDLNAGDNLGAKDEYRTAPGLLGERSVHAQHAEHPHHSEGGYHPCHNVEAPSPSPRVPNHRLNIDDGKYPSVHSPKTQHDSIFSSEQPPVLFGDSVRDNKSKDEGNLQANERNYPAFDTRRFGTGLDFSGAFTSGLARGRGLLSKTTPRFPDAGKGRQQSGVINKITKRIHPDEGHYSGVDAAYAHGGVADSGRRLQTARGSGRTLLPTEVKKRGFWYGGTNRDTVPYASNEQNASLGDYTTFHGLDRGFGATNYNNAERCKDISSGLSSLELKRDQHIANNANIEADTGGSGCGQIPPRITEGQSGVRRGGAYTDRDSTHLPGTNPGPIRIAQERFRDNASLESEKPSGARPFDYCGDGRLERSAKFRTNKEMKILESLNTAKRTIMSINDALSKQ